MWNWIPSLRRSHPTPPQTAYQQACDFWEGHARSISPAEPSRAEAAVRQFYQRHNLAPPRIVWCDSPPAFFEALYWVRHKQPGQEIWEEVIEEQQALFGTIRELFSAERQTLRYVHDNLTPRGSTVRRSLEQGPLLPAIEQTLRSRLPQLSFVAPPASFRTTFLTTFQLLPALEDLALGRVFEAPKWHLPVHLRAGLNLYSEIAQSCWWWWPCESVCLLCQCPTSLALDTSGRLHADRSPALRFPDGWSVYAWQGVLANAEIIEKPESITPERIEEEPNLELRRVMIERYGEERFLEEGGAQIVAIDLFGTLYRRELSGQEPAVMVRVKNSTAEPDGTFKIYRLRVPPWVTTPKEAIAWTFGVQASDYDPAQET